MEFYVNITSIAIVSHIDSFYEACTTEGFGNTKNWDIPNMIIEIKKPIIPGMDIPRKRYIPVTEIWRLIFQGIEKVTSNHRL